MNNAIRGIQFILAVPAHPQQLLGCVIIRFKRLALNPHTHTNSRKTALKHWLQSKNHLFHNIRSVRFPKITREIKCEVSSKRTQDLRFVEIGRFRRISESSRRREALRIRIGADLFRAPPRGAVPVAAIQRVVPKRQRGKRIV